MAGDDLGNHVGEIGLRIDGVELAGLDEGSEDGPMFATAIGASENAFFRLRASGLMVRSTTLESISMRPSSRNRVRPDQRDRA